MPARVPRGCPDSRAEPTLRSSRRVRGGPCVPRCRDRPQRRHRPARGRPSACSSGNRLPERTRDVVTDGLGLVTLLDRRPPARPPCSTPTCSTQVGTSAPILIVLGSVLVGGIVGSLLRIEDRVEGARRLAAAPAHRRRPGRRTGTGSSRASSTASLVFCVGPLTILGSLDDGLGRGIDKLALKATLDGFAAIAFAASLGWGVAASALTVARGPGLADRARLLLGDVLPDAAPGGAHRDRRAAARRGRAAAAADPPGPGGRPAARSGRRSAPGGARGRAFGNALGNATPADRRGHPPHRGMVLGSHYAPGDRNGAHATRTRPTITDVPLVAH